MDVGGTGGSVESNRHHLQAGQEYFIRTLALLAPLFPDSLTTAMIFVAVDAANSTYLLDDPNMLRDYGSELSPPPEVLRRPVSRAAISEALGVPLETCRRHANKLVAQGWCHETSRGLVINAERLETESFRELRRRNATNLRRLIQRVRMTQVED